MFYNVFKLFLIASCSFATFANAVNPNVANLPEPVSNNAVAMVNTTDGQYLISFMGLGQGKTYKDVHNKVWAVNLNDNMWQAKKPVPSSLPLSGRLASVAIGVDEFAYLFGGYTVSADHQEISSPDSFQYDVLTDSYKTLAPMPVPVDDSVALVYQQRYIYLISGWHNAGNVNLVQIYDIKNNTWQQGSPFLGIPVFGQAGAISNNTMVICDGVMVEAQLLKRRTYKGISQCLKGQIDPKQPKNIDWQLIQHPTGVSRYRMAAAGQENKLYFVGGSSNPYNYSGVGYDGQPAPASAELWTYSVDTNQWQVQPVNSKTMDHRGLIMINNEMLTIGGMNDKQQVIDTVTIHVIPPS